MLELRRSPAWLLGLGLSLSACDSAPASNGSGTDGGSSGDPSATGQTDPTDSTDPDPTDTTDPDPSNTGPDDSSTSDDPSESSTSDPSTTGTPADCGDGIAEGNEECDGDDLLDWDCAQFGFVAGELSCNDICQLEFDACENYQCGDGEIERKEVCDGENLDAQTCQTLGFDNGELGCAADCFAFDTGGCGVCGDGVVDLAETCEDGELGDATCITLGFDGGTLACASDCLGYDTSGCTTCGDGVAEGAELCDGDDLDGETCPGLGFFAGALSCDDNCEFDTGLCATDCCSPGGPDDPGCQDSSIEACVCDQDAFCCESDWDQLCVDQAVDSCGAVCSFCGNDILDDSEVCDTNQFGGATCQSSGFDNGSLSCQDNCGTISTASCGNCGDGSIDPAESCDGANLGGQTCTSLGFDGGSLSCSGNCQSFDTSNCIDIPSWSTDVHPIFTANCGCHSGSFAPWAGNPSASTAYDLIVGVAGGGGVQYINPGNPNSSSIVLRVESEVSPMPPDPASPLTAGQQQLIRDWVQAGAPEN